jgi:hypothetical protein
MKMTDGLFHKVFDEIGAEYPDIEKEHWIVDIGAAKLADTPEAFDVIVMPNLYGDILSDVAAQIAGSVGWRARPTSARVRHVRGHPRLGAAPRRPEPRQPLGPAAGRGDDAGPHRPADVAERVHNAWLRTIEDGIHTYDIFKEGVSASRRSARKSSPSGIALRVGAIVAGVALVALVASNGYLLVRNNGLHQEIDNLRQTTRTEIASIEQRTQQQEEVTRQSLEALIEQLRDSQSSASTAADRARVSAQRHAEKLMKTLADLQQRQSDEIATKLTEIERENDEKVTAVKSDVGVVRTDVEQARSALDKTVAELKTVRGDMGVMSGLIATNSKELSALRELGDRNYYEFTLTKSKTPQRVGNVALQLKKTDAKRSKYSLDLIADDRRVEKKEKYINEPVQFYVNGTRAPLEIVVNQVSKDKIIGYLATPKMQAARR